MTPPASSASQHLLRLLALAGWGVWRFDHGPQRLTSTPEVLMWWQGGNQATATSLPLADLQAGVHPDDQAALLHLLTAGSQEQVAPAGHTHPEAGTQAPGVSLRFRVLGPHGHWLWRQGHSLVANANSNDQDQGQARTTLGVLGLASTEHNTTVGDQAEAERAELLERLQNIAAQLPGAIYQYHRRVDGTAHFPYASAALLDIYGVTPDSARHDSSHITRRLHPNDRERISASMAHSAQTLTPWKQEYRVVLPEGITRWVQGQSSPQRLPDGSTLWHGYLHDITRERELRERLRLGASVFANSHDGVVVTNAQHVIVEVNPAFSRITGYDAADVVGKTPKALNADRQREAIYTDMEAALQRHGHWSGELWSQRKNGEQFAQRLSISTVVDDAGHTTHHIGVFSDITQLKSHEAELARIAHYDELTGLPNRRLLGDRMKVALAHTRRGPHTLAVCMLDLDGFKEVNDRLGHAAGDELLVALSQRLAQMLRVGDTLARLGGDEFVLLFGNLAHAQQCHQIMERVLHCTATPVRIHQTEVRVSASVGVTLFPADDADADTLLRHADQAMYVAKQAGRNRCHFFDTQQDRMLLANREQRQRLAQGMDQGELVLHYQPKVSLRTGELLGMEALVRWQHPEQGWLAPAAFLHLTTGSPLEQALGRWVLNTALSQLTQWQGQGLALEMSVNIGAEHLLDAHFAADLQTALQAHPTVNAHRLELEILESAAMHDMGRAHQVLAHCQSLGVRVALDDFGTGYSSLAYFRNLPVDTIKIDQSFVRDMLIDPSDLGIVDSVVRLAEAFSRRAVAEGVETLEHGALLLALGCEWVQGYGIARPMPAAALLPWLQHWQQTQPWQHLPPLNMQPGQPALKLARPSPVGR